MFRQSSRAALTALLLASTASLGCAQTPDQGAQPSAMPAGLPAAMDEALTTYPSA
ncbi:MAG: hypothetical protein GYB36_12190, partial [Alphaproteobacteria bacterium]|nr:hypothetical protein [Alphaproteobacteria bacterium]